MVSVLPDRLSYHGEAIETAHRSFSHMFSVHSMMGLSVALLAVACGPSMEVNTGASQSDLGQDARVTIPTLPSPSGTGALSPWGGTDASRWRPEAIIANAASTALNDAWKKEHVTDAIIAIPTRMLQSTYYEYGDGQSNAAPSFPYWHESRPQVVATLLRTDDDATHVTFRFDHALAISGKSIDVSVDGQTSTVPFVRSADGAAIAEWSPPASLGWSGNFSGSAIAVRPTGWNDWFPIWFRMPVKRIDQVRAAHARYADGKSIVDREGVSSQSSANAGDGSSPYQRLMSHDFTAPYNARGTGHVPPFAPDNIHAFFPYLDHNYVTGVGRGWTWVADEQPSGFKDMYTCFERRRAADEASAPDGGVASGGGWHQIGDRQETILNDLETSPLVVGSAMGNPLLPSALPDGQLAYGNTDVITVRWLMPGEAFITPNGGAARDTNGVTYDQSNYHWFFFQAAQEVCTEEIVTPAGAAPTGFDP
jgi:hypothetical protein